MNKILLSLVIAFMILPTLTGCTRDDTSAQKDVVTRAIEITYLGEGTYDEFVKLFADPQNLGTEIEFEEFRSSLSPSDLHMDDDGENTDIRNNLIISNIDDDHAEVIYVVQTSDGNIFTTEFYCKVIKVDKEWKMSYY